MPKSKLLCILGQTGTGKTSLALALAKKKPISVINFDSRQVYKDFPIVTAQPSFEEQKECPHYLFGFLEVDKKITAGEFVRLAKERIKKEIQKGRFPVLVGGTGLYLKALLYGLAPIPEISSEVRDEVENLRETKGLGFLYSFLQKVDSVYANRIHPNDKQRITRALEVYLQTGKPFSTWHQKTPSEKKYNFLKVGLKMDVNILVDYLSERIEKMIEQGAIDEVKRAIVKYKDKTLPGFSGIGIPEIIEYLENKISFKEMQRKWLKNTRAYAKRQLTWFKKEKDVFWFSPLNPKEAIQYIEQWLK